MATFVFGKFDEETVKYPITEQYDAFATRNKK